MVRTRSDHLVLWPTYFDSRKTRAKGRRVRKNQAIERPTALEIFKIVKSMDLDVRLEAGKAYPGSWWEKEGAVFVEKSMAKTELIEKVAARLKEIEHNRETK